ncbi:molecular chaperone DnaJ [Novosphingobium aerophilum]|uniref:J domain-containing protein n=1 Tax=Novosphingobium TaxID=165696 RepID=UPI0012D0FE55|nr:MULTISPECIES: J domain-containing protein [unclassified Novosphingobium]MPS67585.1 molecular chaperone DnaJ [Novosphingobium sp.]WRT93157.1 J domain-containing protein [Novosphingobium sp. RL4]
MKLLWLIALGCIAWRLIKGRWPWQGKSLPGPSFADVHANAQARALLGVAEGAGRREILDAHRRVVTQVHPDKGGSNEKVHEANAARDLLLARLGDVQG